MDHPDFIALISSTGDITTQTPPEASNTNIKGLDFPFNVDDKDQSWTSQGSTTPEPKCNIHDKGVISNFQGSAQTAIDDEDCARIFQHSTPSTYGEHLIDFDKEGTPFDEPPSPISLTESPIVYADVVGSYAATPPSSYGQHLAVYSVSPSHYAEHSSIERQLTLAGILLDSKIAEIEAISDLNILDSTIETSSLSSEQECTSH